MSYDPRTDLLLYIPPWNYKNDYLRSYFKYSITEEEKTEISQLFKEYASFDSLNMATYQPGDFDKINYPSIISIVSSNVTTFFKRINCQPQPFILHCFLITLYFELNPYGLLKIQRSSIISQQLGLTEQEHYDGINAAFAYLVHKILFQLKTSEENVA